MTPLTALLGPRKLRHPIRRPVQLDPRALTFVVTNVDGRTLHVTAHGTTRAPAERSSAARPWNPLPPLEDPMRPSFRPLLAALARYTHGAAAARITLDLRDPGGLLPNLAGDDARTDAGHP